PTAPGRDRYWISPFRMTNPRSSAMPTTMLPASFTSRATLKPPLTPRFVGAPFTHFVAVRTFGVTSEYPTTTPAPVTDYGTDCPEPPSPSDGRLVNVPLFHTNPRGPAGLSSPVMPAMWPALLIAVTWLSVCPGTGIAVTVPFFQSVGVPVPWSVYAVPAAHPEPLTAETWAAMKPAGRPSGVAPAPVHAKGVREYVPQAEPTTSPDAFTPETDQSHVPVGNPGEPLMGMTFSMSNHCWAA